MQLSHLHANNTRLMAHTYAEEQRSRHDFGPSWQ